MRLMNILLVDDDETIRAGMKKIIMDVNRGGWNVIAEAGDGEMALQKMIEFPNIHLIITDVRMPIMDGIQFIQTVRKTNSAVKIIMLSGYDDFNYVREAFMNGAVDYLLKPFQKKDLIARIEMIEKDILTAEKEARYQIKSKHVMVTDTIAHLLKGENIDRNIRELGSLGIRTDLPCYFVIAIRADQYFNQLQDIQQYEKRLLEDLDIILTNLVKGENFDYCYYTNSQELIMLLFCSSKEDGEKAFRKIFNILQRDQAELNTDSMGISNAHYDSLEVSKAYEEAEDAVQARFYLGQNKQIFYQDIYLKCIDIQYDLEPMVSQLVHHLELCDYIGARKVMEQIFIDLSYCKPKKFREYMHRMIEMLSIRIRDFEKILLVYGADHQFQIEYINTYRELKTYLGTILQGTIQYIQNERKKKSQKRIELAKAFIGVNYQKPLSLNDVADYVELNSSYFSNLFKEETGMNFTDYLLNVRMENAKKLLRDPKIKVYEVGILVGYEDAVSFGRAFKKKLGMSPKEYRNSVY